MSILPNAKTQPKPNLGDLTVLVYGQTKIGKSTLCSQSDGALFLATEPGLNSLDVFQVPIQSWEDLLAACAEVGEGKHAFQTIIIDTIDNAYRFCTEYNLRKFKVEHESDLAYGKGYAIVNNEFQRVLMKLAFLPYGLYLISHAREVEVETRTGKYTRVVPTLPLVRPCFLSNPSMRASSAAFCSSPILWTSSALMLVVVPTFSSQA